MPTAPDSHLTSIQRIFERYTGRYHFYLRDLVGGAEFEFGTPGRYPLCSCFKLAVLGALFDSLSSESQLEEEVLFTPEQFSPGGGVLSYLTVPVRLTVFQLAEFMMAFSDGTATDEFCARVGKERVRAYLARYTRNSAWSRNLREVVATYNAALLGLLQQGVGREAANEHILATLLRQA
jgi:beta-lactamase class A